MNSNFIERRSRSGATTKSHNPKPENSIETLYDWLPKKGNINSVKRLTEGKKLFLCLQGYSPRTNCKLEFPTTGRSVSTSRNQRTTPTNASINQHKWQEKFEKYDRCMSSQRARVGSEDNKSRNKQKPNTHGRLIQNKLYVPAANPIIHKQTRREHIQNSSESFNSTYKNINLNTSGKDILSTTINNNVSELQQIPTPALEILKTQKEAQLLNLVTELNYRKYQPQIENGHNKNNLETKLFEEEENKPLKMGSSRLVDRVNKIGYNPSHITKKQSKPKINSSRIHSADLTESAPTTRPEISTYREIGPTPKKPQIPSLNSYRYNKPMKLNSRISKNLQSLIAKTREGSPCRISKGRIGPNNIISKSRENEKNISISYLESCLKEFEGARNTDEISEENKINANSFNETQPKIIKEEGSLSDLSKREFNNTNPLPLFLNHTNYPSPIKTTNVYEIRDRNKRVNNRSEIRINNKKLTRTKHRRGIVVNEGDIKSSKNILTVNNSGESTNIGNIVNIKNRNIENINNSTHNHPKPPSNPYIKTPRTRILLNSQINPHSRKNPQISIQTAPSSPIQKSSIANTEEKKEFTFIDYAMVRELNMANLETNSQGLKWVEGTNTNNTQIVNKNTRLMEDNHGKYTTSNGRLGGTGMNNAINNGINNLGSLLEAATNIPFSHHIVDALNSSQNKNTNREENLPREVPLYNEAQLAGILSNSKPNNYPAYTPKPPQLDIKDQIIFEERTWENEISISIPRVDIDTNITYTNKSLEMLDSDESKLFDVDFHTQNKYSSTLIENRTPRSTQDILKSDTENGSNITYKTEKCNQDNMDILVKLIEEKPINSTDPVEESMDIGRRTTNINLSQSKELAGTSTLSFFHSSLPHAKTQNPTTTHPQANSPSTTYSPKIMRKSVDSRGPDVDWNSIFNRKHSSYPKYMKSNNKFISSSMNEKLKNELENLVSEDELRHIRKIIQSSMDKNMGNVLTNDEGSRDLVDKSSLIATLQSERTRTMLESKAFGSLICMQGSDEEK